MDLEPAGGAQVPMAVQGRVSMGLSPKVEAEVLAVPQEESPAPVVAPLERAERARPAPAAEPEESAVPAATPERGAPPVATPERGVPRVGAERAARTWGFLPCGSSEEPTPVGARAARPNIRGQA